MGGYVIILQIVYKLKIKMSSLFLDVFLRMMFRTAVNSNNYSQ